MSVNLSNSKLPNSTIQGVNNSLVSLFVSEGEVLVKIIITYLSQLALYDQKM